MLNEIFGVFWALSTFYLANISYWLCLLDAWTTVLGTLRLFLKFIPTQLVKPVLRLCLINGRPNSGLYHKKKEKGKEMPFVITCQNSFKVDADICPNYDWNQQHSQSLHHWQKAPHVAHTFTLLGYLYPMGNHLLSRYKSSESYLNDYFSFPTPFRRKSAASAWKVQV